MSHPWFNDFYALIARTPLAPWLNVLPGQLAQWMHREKHSGFSKWAKLIDKLPQVAADQIALLDEVRFDSDAGISDYQRSQIEGLLRQFMPWRKGPFHLHGIHLDTEWRSDWKWERVIPHISPLRNKLVLDVGCGSGYHLWRMKGQGARIAVGIDPMTLFLIQFQAIKHFNPDPDVHLLPVGVDDLPALQAFDTVFSMGVLYHRRSPVDFLHQLKNQLVSGGELVLETLVVEGDENTVFMPGERYAQMRNVWFLPSTAALCQWLQRCGFTNVRVVDENYTELEEQRSTPWMTNHSLTDFLDPDDKRKTIEGYPAPLRAVIVANAK